MKKLLITGSRDCTPEMVKYVYDYLANSKPEFVIVGDARGIDTAVCFACMKYDIPLKSYGKTDIARHKLSTKRVPYEKCADTFWERDAYMVDLADYVLGVWNGFSHGTSYTIGLAIFKGIETTLVDFSKEIDHGRITRY